MLYIQLYINVPLALEMQYQQHKFVELSIFSHFNRFWINSNRRSKCVSWFSYRCINPTQCPIQFNFFRKSSLLTGRNPVKAPAKSKVKHTYFHFCVCTAVSAACTRYGKLPLGETRKNKSLFHSHWPSESLAETLLSARWCHFPLPTILCITQSHTPTSDLWFHVSD